MTDDSPVIDTGNANTKDADYLSQADAIIAAFEETPTLANGWTPGMPNHVNLKEVRDRYRPACVAAQDGGSGNVAIRNAIRKEFVTMYCKIAKQMAALEVVYPGVIVAAKFKVKKPKTSGNTNQRKTPKAPVPTARHGKFTGSVDVACDRMPGAGSYLAQYTALDPLLEGSWTQGISSLHSRLTITNLQQATRVYIRMCGIWPTGQGPWSQTISIIVV